MKQKLLADSSATVAILCWLRERREEMAALLAELVAIPTENPLGNNYRACADLLEPRIRGLGLECKRIVPAGAGDQREDDPASLLASYGSGEKVFEFVCTTTSLAYMIAPHSGPSEVAKIGHSVSFGTENRNQPRITQT